MVEETKPRRFWKLFMARLASIYNMTPGISIACCRGQARAGRVRHRDKNVSHGVAALDSPFSGG
jgi:hypothetical protein